jgi:hypothetical protein
MKFKTVLLTGVFLSLTSGLHAQTPPFTSHYVPGVEGIKGASLPPPGFYLRDYNAFYTTDRLNQPNGHNTGMNVDAVVYANVIRGIWVSNWQILGGNFFMDALVPFQYADVKLGSWNDSHAGLGDICLEPAGVSWHGAQWDAALAYALYLPTGDSSPPPFSAKPGKGFWGHMITAGATLYFDQEKTWALSLLNRYEINERDGDTHITPGNQWTLEWGISKSLKPTIDVGFVGYYQLQTTKDSGAGASNDRDQVLAVGPEVSVFCPEIGMFTSLRYNYEVLAKDRPQGQILALTFTKAF